MHIRPLLLIAALAVPLLPVASPLEAATLEEIRGEMLVDHGAGFALVSGPTALNPGDTVIANPGGGALIVYSNECKVPVQPGAVVTVHKQSPCSGDGGGGGSGEGISTTTLLIGGAVVGLGAGAAVLLTADDEDEPASP
jgi:hypothetical protein